MTENTNTTTPVAATPKAARKPAKKAAKAKAIPSANGELHPHKLLVLRKINTGGNTTIGGLTSKTKLTHRACYHAVYHLREDRYIKPNVIEVKDGDKGGKKETHYVLTPKGRKAI